MRASASFRWEFLAYLVRLSLSGDALSEGRRRLLFCAKDVTTRATQRAESGQFFSRRLDQKEALFSVRSNLNVPKELDNVSSGFGEQE